MRKNIRDEFKTKGLKIDMPKGSTGNTYDGNTARLFFRDSKFAADVTGIDATFIEEL